MPRAANTLSQNPRTKYKPTPLLQTVRNARARYALEPEPFVAICKVAHLTNGKCSEQNPCWMCKKAGKLGSCNRLEAMIRWNWLRQPDDYSFDCGCGSRLMFGSHLAQLLHICECHNWNMVEAFVAEHETPKPKQIAKLLVMPVRETESRYPASHKATILMFSAARHA